MKADPMKLVAKWLSEAAEHERKADSILAELRGHNCPHEDPSWLLAFEHAKVASVLAVCAYALKAELEVKNDLHVVRTDNE